MSEASRRGEPLELIHYNSSTGHFEVGNEALSVLKALRGPVSVVAVCGRARQVSRAANPPCPGNCMCRQYGMFDAAWCETLQLQLLWGVSCRSMVCAVVCRARASS
jgi:hypothetical protein